jgi:hypothetical protein
LWWRYQGSRCDFFGCFWVAGTGGWPKRVAKTLTCYGTITKAFGRQPRLQKLGQQTNIRQEGLAWKGRGMEPNLFFARGGWRFLCSRHKVPVFRAIVLRCPSVLLYSASSYLSGLCVNLKTGCRCIKAQHRSHAMQGMLHRGVVRIYDLFARFHARLQLSRKRKASGKE